LYESPLIFAVFPVLIDPTRLLADLKDTPLSRALAAVVAGGGTVGAFGAASGLFGATAPLPTGEGMAFAYGLALLSGTVVLPGSEASASGCRSTSRGPRLRGCSRTTPSASGPTPRRPPASP